MAILAVKNAHFWRNNVEILKNINLSLNEGEALSILGRNGAGKTTLLKCIVNLLKWSSGESLLFDKPLRDYAHKDIWKLISYVPQAKSQIFDISVIDMIALGLSPFVALSPKPRHIALAKAMLEKLNLTHLAHKTCLNLSGGELQMVLFARALVKSPKILILDEPESNLDFANQKIILEALKDLREQKCAIIINTHFPYHARFLSHKSILLFRASECKASVDSKSAESKIFAKLQHTNALFDTAKNVLDSTHLSALYGVPLSIDTTLSQEQYVLRI